MNIYTLITETDAANPSCEVFLDEEERDRSFVLLLAQDDADEFNRMWALFKTQCTSDGLTGELSEIYESLQNEGCWAYREDHSVTPQESECNEEKLRAACRQALGVLNHLQVQAANAALESLVEALST